MRHIALAGIAAIAAFFVLTGRPAPVAAECDGPFPAFREVAETARTVVIGTVVAVESGGAWDPFDDGISSRFTLQIESVVRGASDSVVRIVDMPTQPCAPVIVARMGDRIALAVGGFAFTPPIEANMIAWIDQEPPPTLLSDSAIVFTVDEVYAMTGQQVPLPPAPAEATFPWLASIVVAILAVAGGGVVGFGLWRRSSDEGPR